LFVSNEWKEVCRLNGIDLKDLSPKPAIIVVNELIPVWVNYNLGKAPR